MSKDKIVVLLGGESPEREVSLKSGEAISKSLSTQGYDVVAVDLVGCDLVRKLLEINPKACYIALHGEDGENGRVQALLDGLRIPYTTAGMRSSVIAMDKMLSKETWLKDGLLTPKARILRADLSQIDGLSFPVVVKPTSTGSSVGISKVDTIEGLEKAYLEAAKYGEVMVEEWITGKEMTVAMLDDEVFSSVWIEPKNAFYDYESKYSGQSSYHSPSGLSQAKELEIRELAKKAYDSLDCKGHARVDFIYSQGEFYLIEINTSPGMTEFSLAPMSAKPFGYDFDKLVKKILESAR
mgnify:CR=1 FL=1